MKRRRRIFSFFPLLFWQEEVENFDENKEPPSEKEKKNFFFIFIFFWHEKQENIIENKEPPSEKEKKNIFLICSSWQEEEEKFDEGAYDPQSVPTIRRAKT